jgi:hypothetical protein
MNGRRDKSKEGEKGKERKKECRKGGIGLGKGGRKQ